MSIAKINQIGIQELLQAAETVENTVQTLKREALQFSTVTENQSETPNHANIAERRIVRRSNLM